MLKTIDKNKYLQLLGLLTISKGLIHNISEVEEGIRNLLDVKEEDECFGVGDPEHINDAIYCEYTPQVLLKKLGIKRC